jgi:hypothetical protein
MIDEAFTIIGCNLPTDRFVPLKQRTHEFFSMLFLLIFLVYQVFEELPFAEIHHTVKFEEL